MGKAKDIIRKLKRLLRGEVYYVNGPDTLPPPLTRSEEAEVFAGPQMTLLHEKS